VPAGGAASLDTFDAVVTFKDEIFGAQFFGVEIDLF
jgi:hypothetical protein